MPENKDKKLILVGYINHVIRFFWLRLFLVYSEADRTRFMGIVGLTVGRPPGWNTRGGKWDLVLTLPKFRVKRYKDIS